MGNKNGDFIGRELLRLACNDYDNMAPIMGDSLESASPADATFWPIHPTTERLFTWRRIHGFLNTEWRNNVSWSVRGYETGYCSGHNWEDVLTWPNYIFEDAGFEGPFTNADLWGITDPMFDRLPYVYENFYWPHCKDAGYPLTLIETHKGPSST